MSTMPPNPITLAASRAQTEAHRGEYGPDSADVALLARSAMTLSPAAAVRIGLLLVRAGLEKDPSVLAQEQVAGDLTAIGEIIFSIGAAA
jgi:hypothetical protein